MRADKLITLLIAVSFVQEILAWTFEFLYGSNLNTYYVYSPLELMAISMYFEFSVPKVRKYHIGIWVSAIGIVTSVICSVFLNANDLFSVFILVEGVAIILFCLYSFYAILMREDANPLPMAHFWIVICLLLYYSVTFTGWGLYSMLEDSHTNPLLHTISVIRHVSNYLFYAGIAFIFIRYPKLIPSGGD